MCRSYLANCGYCWLYGFRRIFINEKIAQKIPFSNAVNGVTARRYSAQRQLSAIFTDCKPRAMDHNASRYGKFNSRIACIHGNFDTAAIVTNDNRFVKLTEKVICYDIALDCYIVGNCVGVTCGQRLQVRDGYYSVRSLIVSRGRILTGREYYEANYRCYNPFHLASL